MGRCIDWVRALIETARPSFIRQDEEAMELFQLLFPDRRVVGVYTRDVLLGGGNIHCITQQQSACFCVPVAVCPSFPPTNQPLCSHKRRRQAPTSSTRYEICGSLPRHVLCTEDHARAQQERRHACI